MDDCRKVDAVIGGSERHVRRLRFGIVRVNEVDETSGFDTVDKCVGLRNPKLVPSHVRDGDALRNSADATAEEVEAAVQAELLTLGEEKVHAETDAESGRAGLHLFE